MNRRTMLKLLSGTIAAACSAVVAIPGVSYVFATVRRQKSDGALTKRVVRLEDLVPGRPVEFAITGNRQDAWTLYPQEPIGRVWLLRRTDEVTPAAESRVDAFTTVCPHLGCAIKLEGGGQGFICPCHKGRFQLTGEPVGREASGHANPVPRGMDALDCRLVDDETGQWWVEVKYEKFEHGLTTKVAQA